MDKAYLPEWGLFPVEQYLIRYWDPSLSEPADSQRLRLIHEFLELDEIPIEWDPTLRGSSYAEPSRIPTVDEINIILRPWRSDKLRKIAWRIWGYGSSHLILLRTHYNRDDNYKIEELVGSDELDDDRAWWALLNDQEFDFGDQWWLVFNILPELAGPLQSYSRLPSQELIARDRQHLKNKLPRLKATEETKRTRCIEIETAYFRRTISQGYFAIADREAFEKDMLRLIYLDGKRNIVQETRADFDEDTLAEVAVEWEELALPLKLWENGIIGEKYRIDGEIGRVLYQLEEAHLD
ncbi:hypothetical protein PHISCL_07582 [Aspergillus sclerotialis]|uniref:Uncharacterized protein n=1 Tax=Aspergillus sclerotialis TaxID=2070753 RepID=A0A3A2ZFH5_9EURO|nr:hypothetical protein PHISCL_07582 [Aspergillus sclerotialis]